MRFAFLVEALVMLAVLATLGRLLGARPGFAGAQPHPYYAVALLVTVRYGFSPGLAAAGLASALYFVELLTGVEAASWRDFLALEYSKPVVVMLAGAGVVGLVVERHIRRLASLEAELGRLHDQARTLEQDRADLRDVNAELANRIVGTEATLPTLYKYARQLNQPEEGAIYEGLVEVLQDALRADAVSVYDVVGDGARRRLGPGPEDLPVSDRLVARLTREGGVLTLTDLPPPGPEGPPIYMAGALRAGDGGPVVAILTVDRIDFLRYTEASLRLFRVLVDWAAASIGTARRLAQMSAPEREQERRHADASSRRAAHAFAQTGRIVLNQEALAAYDDSTQPATPGFGRAAVPATQMLDMDDLEVLEESGGNLQSALAAEVGRAEAGRERFATLLADLNQFLGQGRR